MLINIIRMPFLQEQMTYKSKGMSACRFSLSNLAVTEIVSSWNMFCQEKCEHRIYKKARENFENTSGLTELFGSKHIAHIYQKY